MRVSVNNAGLFTGKLYLAGASWSFGGALDAEGAATVTIPHSGTPPYVITVQADLTGSSGEVTGSVSNGTESFGYVVDESAFNSKTNPAPQAGHYTLVLASDPNVTGTGSAAGEWLCLHRGRDQWRGDSDGPAWQMAPPIPPPDMWATTARWPFIPSRAALRADRA